jgi:hypothetical protein
VEKASVGNSADAVAKKWWVLRLISSSLFALKLPSASCLFQSKRAHQPLPTESRSSAKCNPRSYVGKKAGSQCRSLQTACVRRAIRSRQRICLRTKRGSIYHDFEPGPVERWRRATVGNLVKTLRFKIQVVHNSLVEHCPKESPSFAYLNDPSRLSRQCNACAITTRRTSHLASCFHLRTILLHLSTAYSARPDTTVWFLMSSAGTGPGNNTEF